MATVAAGVKRTFAEMHETSKQPQNRHSLLEARHRRATSQIGNTDGVSSHADHSSEGEKDSGRNTHLFEPDTSIVLIGVRGVGKSSLGVLASSAYNRRLIETERVFFDETGSTQHEYRKLQGSAAFAQRHRVIFRKTLAANSRNCVIVCNFLELESDGGRLLREYARSHPVIHVTRDIQGVQSYVQTLSKRTVEELVQASKAILRACTNYEFYNISEHMEKSSPNSDHSGQPLTRLARGPFLTLKRAEHDFLRLLRSILGDNARHSSHHSVYPLSRVSLESMEFSSVVRLSAADIVAQTLDLDDVQTGADAIELEASISPENESRQPAHKQRCFDLASEAFAILRRTTILPIIVSYGNSTGSDRRLIAESELIDHCLRLGPDYCRINLSLSDALLTRWMRRRSRTKMIGSFTSSHRPELGWKDPECLKVYEKARCMGFDLLEFSMPAESTWDSFDSVSFSRGCSDRLQEGPKVSAYCTGRLGRSSMCFNNFLTPVRPPKQLDGSDNLLTAKQRNEALFAAMIYDPLHFFIYGADVGFSLSPVMHNAAYKACGMTHVFGTHSASNLDDFNALTRQHDFGGAAVVQPYKTATIALMDTLSPQARVIGAINTVIPIRDSNSVTPSSDGHSISPGRNRSGPVKSLHGDNTDWIGIRACIRRSLSPANTIRPHSTGLVCGAGGMARAGIFALITLGVKNIYVCNRTKQHAEALAEHFNGLIRTNSITEASLVETEDVRVEALDAFSSAWPTAVRHPTMIVSCIPTQTANGDPTDFALPPDWLSSPTGGVVVELAYMPIVRPVVAQVRKLAHKGWILMDGLDVLPEQAFAQFELFTGKRAPRKLMRDEAFRHYSEDAVPQQGALNTDSPTHS